MYPLVGSLVTGNPGFFFLTLAAIRGRLLDVTNVHTQGCHVTTYNNVIYDVICARYRCGYRFLTRRKMSDFSLGDSRGEKLHLRFFLYDVTSRPK